MQERLQKLIARAGIASRRHAEELILSGQVTVNGQIVSELGSKADPDTDHIKVRGKLLRFSERKLYYVLNKPPACVSTMSDPENRRTLRDYLQGIPGRVFPAGRLDYHAEGLILLTSDGELAHRLMKISRRLLHTYWIKVKGALKPQELQETERFAGARISPIPGRGSAENPWYVMTLTEPRSDMLRYFLARMGHPMEKLRRVRIGPLDMGPLAPGENRKIEPGELTALVSVVNRAMGDRPARKRTGKEPARQEGTAAAAERVRSHERQRKNQSRMRQRNS